MTDSLLHVLSWVMVLAGLSSSAFVAWDLRRRQPQPMAVMNYVWPINALWGGVLGIWAYWPSAECRRVKRARGRRRKPWAPWQ